MIKTLNDALIRIAELEKENEALKESLSKYEGKKPAGRKVHGGTWTESYNDFVVKYEDGMSIAAIVESSNISRRTAYRYKKYYEMLMGEKSSAVYAMKMFQAQMAGEAEKAGITSEEDIRVLVDEVRAESEDY